MKDLLRGRLCPEVPVGGYVGTIGPLHSGATSLLQAQEGRLLSWQWGEAPVHVSLVHNYSLLWGAWWAKEGQEGPMEIQGPRSRVLVEKRERGMGICSTESVQQEKIMPFVDTAVWSDLEEDDQWEDCIPRIVEGQGQRFVLWGLRSCGTLVSFDMDKEGAYGYMDTHGVDGMLIVSRSVSTHGGNVQVRHILRGEDPAVSILGSLLTAQYLWDLGLLATQVAVVEQGYHLGKPSVVFIEKDNSGAYWAGGPVTF